MVKKPSKSHLEFINWLRGTEKWIGQLYPVLKTRDGEVLDGRRRLEANPNWYSKIVDLDRELSPPERILITLASNVLRRSIPKKEKAEKVNRLAEIARDSGINPGKISSVLTGYAGVTRRRVVQLLDPQFRRSYRRDFIPSRSPEEQAQLISELDEVEAELAVPSLCRLQLDLKEIARAVGKKRAESKHSGEKGYCHQKQCPFNECCSFLTEAIEKVRKL